MTSILEPVCQISFEYGQTVSSSIINICPVLQLTNVIDNFILRLQANRHNYKFRDDLFYKKI